MNERKNSSMNERKNSNMNDIDSNKQIYLNIPNEFKNNNIEVTSSDIKIGCNNE